MRLDNDSKSNKPTEVQLSLMDYQLGNLDFDETKKSKAKIPYTPVAKNKTPRFLTLSAAIHATAFFTLAFASIPLVNDLKPETITIELADNSEPMTEQPLHQLAKGADVEASQGSQAALPVKEELAEKPEPTEMAPVAAQMPAAKIASEDLKLPESAPIIAPPPQDIADKKEEIVAKKAEPVKAAPAVAKAAAAKAVAATKPAAPAKTTMAAVPATIEDIQDPELDKGEVADHAEAAPVADDLNEDLDKEDSKQAAALAKEKEKMEQMAAAVASEQDETLNSVANENAEEAKKLAAANENMKQKNAAMVAKAEAADRAQKEAQARDEQEAANARAAAAQQARNDAAAKAAAAQAASLAAAKAQAAQAAKEAQQAQAAQAGQGNGSGQGVGDGAGNAGAATASTQLAGAPTGVRSLEQLRQKPGNPRPMYSPQERLLGQTGEVGFVAYITKEGVPTQFKMIKSTGHENLDTKTLAALKKWKFYPGQEGWVELPFKWDLKGETQEAGGLLRNSVSAR